eukprot:8432439-Alexandrium_andersonii.AAC.1
MRYSPKDKCHVAMVKACDEPTVTAIEAGGSVTSITKVEDRKMKEDQQPRVVLAGVQVAAPPPKPVVMEKPRAAARPWLASVP